MKTIRDVTGCHVADVFTMFSLLIPEQLDLRSGKIEVDATGALSFTADAAGPHRLAHAKVAGRACREEILRRLLSAPETPQADLGSQGN